MLSLMSGLLNLDLRRCLPVSEPTKIVTIKHVQGMEVPNIGALSETTKDWLYSGGLYQPPQPKWNLATFSSAFSWGPIGVHSFNSWVPLTARPLPVEKREMPVVGYRAWGFSSKFRIGHGRAVALKSTGADHYWKQGENHAHCSNGDIHPAPDQNCACGFYVLANLDEVEKHAQLNEGTVVGAVMGWGKVVQHGTEGWRAEYAKIIALLDCKYSKGQLRNTRQAAEAYGVEVKMRRPLEAMVSEWGDPFAA